MRSKTGWSALLLAAGAALAPTGAWAQPGVDNPADPVVPLPLYHPRADVVGGMYTALEFVMFRQTNPIRRQLLAVRGLVDVDGSITGDLNGTVVNTDTNVPFIIRGPLVPGNFLGTGTPALFSDDLRGQETYQPGYKLTVGYRFDNGSALEASWLHIQKATYTANASLIPTNYANLAAGGAFLADTFLFLPFFNLPPEFAGANQKLALGNPGAAFGLFNGDINAAISFVQRFEQFDVRGRVPWYQDDCLRCYGYAGGRFAWIWEQFKLRAVSADFLGQSLPEDVGLYTNTVSNRMYGAFAGFGVERYLGYGFAAGLEMEAAALADIARAKAQVQNGDRPSAARTVPFVEIKKALSDFNPVAEVGANAQLYWYPVEGIQLRVGWNFMSFYNTLFARDPVAFDVRNFDPQWKNRSVRFFDGFNAGFGFIF
jgi:hypothetical protein